jgi:hypothetical protein
MEKKDRVTGSQAETAIPRLASDFFPRSDPV